MNVPGRKMTARGPWLETSGPHPPLPLPCVAAPAPVKSPGPVMLWDCTGMAQILILCLEPSLLKDLSPHTGLEPNCAELCVVITHLLLEKSKTSESLHLFVRGWKSEDRKQPSSVVSQSARKGCSALQLGLSPCCLDHPLHSTRPVSCGCSEVPRGWTILGSTRCLPTLYLISQGFSS